jgi:serine protease SohB
MTEFIAEYGLFLLKAATIVGAIVVVVGTVATASRKAAMQEGLEIEHLNKKY